MAPFVDWAQAHKEATNAEHRQVRQAVALLCCRVVCFEFSGRLQVQLAQLILCGIEQAELMRHAAAPSGCDTSVATKLSIGQPSALSEQVPMVWSGLVISTAA